MSVAVLHTERLLLRPIEAKDYTHWLDFYASDHARYLGDPKTAEETWWKVNQFLGHWVMTGFGYWSVLDHDGTYYGRVGIEQAPAWPEPELGWSLLHSATGKSIAYEAAVAIRRYAYSALNMKTLASFIVPDNTPSLKLAKRMGCSDVTGTYECPYKDHLIFRHPTQEELV
jgi:RimJ/RimL family protein N-acetyltransferase